MAFEFKNYFERFSEKLMEVDPENLTKAANLITKHRLLGGKLIFIGNGGSAAISSHLSVDFTKACKIRSINFNEADLLTCFSNDYGYSNWCKEALSAYADASDIVILISSSGTSENILNAARFCVQNNLKLITFSGFSSKNPLRSYGDLNFYVSSDIYNFVEMVHHTWLVAIVDLLSGVDLRGR